MKKEYIITEAKQIKTYIEKNKKLPRVNTFTDGKTLSIYQTSYLLGKLIQNNFKANDYTIVTNIVLYNTPKPYTDTIVSEKVLKEDYLKMIANFLNFCINNRRVPAFITTQKSKTKVSYELFTYCLAKIVSFYAENKTLPNYCIFNKGDIQSTSSNAKPSKNNNNQSTSTCTNPYTSTPHLLTTAEGLGQDYPYDCGANAVQQCLYKLGKKKIDEFTLMRVMGVTTSGVGHDGINTGFAWYNKKYGANYKVTWKNFSDLGKTRDARFEALAKLLCKSNTAVLTHIGYANEGKSPITKDSKIFGHYEVLDKVNTKTKYVRALNSLGKKINSHAYAGHLQDRTYETQASFFSNTPARQKALCIITK